MKSKAQLFEKITKTNKERYEYLCNLFRCMPEEVAKEFQYIEFKKGERIILAGEPCKTVYILLDGEIKGKDYDMSGSVYSFLDFSKMCILGDFELYTEAKEYGISVFTGKNCKAVKISAERYLGWIRHDENALYNRLKNILTILTLERKKDREYIRMSCKERLVDYLVTYYEKESRTLQQKTIKVRVTQPELAEKIGANVRSVQRVIASLLNEAFVSVESGKMVIDEEQYQRLREMAE